MLRRLLILLVLFSICSQAQHTIKGTFLPAGEYEWILLYRNAPNSAEYIAKEKIDSLGNFKIELDSNHKEGMYKLVYNVPQETYNFDFIYNGKEDIELLFQNNVVDYKISEENKLMSSYTKSMALITQSIGNYYKQNSRDDKALVELFNTLKTTQQEYEKLAEGKMVYHFILANRPYFPEGYLSVSDYVSKIKAAYFANVDFTNETLLSSSFLIERALNYVFGMSGNGTTDSEVYKNNLLELANHLESASSETKKTIYYVLWQQLSSANYEEVANFISDKYLIGLATQLKETKLVEELKMYKALSTGQPAPNFDITRFEDGKTVKTQLKEINTSQYYILVFWSSSCSHCLEELPKLQQLIKSIPENELKVIAFGLEDDEYKWRSETYNYPEFIHACGLGKWENETGNAYNVTSTPTYFVLDHEKKILAKPINFEELLTVFQ